MAQDTRALECREASSAHECREASWSAVGSDSATPLSSERWTSRSLGCSLAEVLGAPLSRLASSRVHRPSTAVSRYRLPPHSTTLPRFSLTLSLTKPSLHRALSQQSRVLPNVAKHRAPRMSRSVERSRMSRSVVECGGKR